MRLVIGIEGAGADPLLRSLYAWLDERSVLRPELISSDVQPGEQYGAQARQLAVELSGATALPALGAAIAAWRSRNRADDRTLTLKSGDLEIRIPDSADEDVARLVSTALLPEDEPVAPTANVRPTSDHSDGEPAGQGSLGSTPPGPPFGDDDDEW